MPKGIKIDCDFGNIFDECGGRRLFKDVGGGEKDWICTNCYKQLCEDWADHIWTGEERRTPLKGA